MPRLTSRALAALLLASAPGAACADAPPPASEWSGPRAFAYRHLVDSVYADQPGVGLLSTEALSEALGSGAITLLDSRTRPEFDVSHLAGARWVGYETFDPARVADLPRETPLVVYCSIGYRSGDIAQRLMDAGFTDVRNLYGGIFLWYNENRPVYRDGTAVDEIHPFDWLWGRWVARGARVTEPPERSPEQETSP